MSISRAIRNVLSNCGLLELSSDKNRARRVYKTFIVTYFESFFGQLGQKHRPIFFQFTGRDWAWIISLYFFDSRNFIIFLFEKFQKNV